MQLIPWCIIDMIVYPFSKKKSKVKLCTKMHEMIINILVVSSTCCMAVSARSDLQQEISLLSKSRITWMSK